MDLPTRSDGQERAKFPTIIHFLVHAAEKNPEGIAVICGDHSLTYREVSQSAASLASTLKKRGIKRGKRIAVLTAVSSYLPQIIFGCMGSGAQVAMMNANFTIRELEPLFRISEPKAVLSDPKLVEALLPLSKELGFEVITISNELWDHQIEYWDLDNLPGSNELGILLFTGGTTGISKGVPHTHGQIISALVAIEDRWPTRLDHEVFLNIPPLFHIVGLFHGCFQPVYGRSTAILISRFNPEEVFNLISEYKVTVCVAGVPAAYTAMLNHPGFDQTNFASLRFACGGGAPLGQETLEDWERRTGVPVLEGYGMTEGAPTCNNPFIGERRILSVGKPVIGIELQIVDLNIPDKELQVGEPGEIRVKGAHIANGYFNSNKETAAAFRKGWLYTGDIGYRDKEGFIYIVDRAQDMAIVSGFNVFPREIDEVLLMHPEINEAAAIGIGNVDKGEVIIAFVSLNEGSKITDVHIKAYCRENLVGYKVPEKIKFVDKLPKTPVGKIDKNKLRK